MEGIMRAALDKAGFFSEDVSSADIKFLATLRNQAESALNKKGHNASLAAHVLIGTIDGRTFRDGPLTDWLESLAERMHQPKTAEKATERMPQGHAVRADAAVPSPASEAGPTMPQGHVVHTSEADSDAVGTAPETIAEAARGVPQGHRCVASAAAAVPREPSPAVRAAMLAGRRSDAAAIFDRIGGALFGDMTQIDFINLGRGAARIGSLAQRIVTDLPWPDRDQTLLRKVATADQARTIYDASFRSLDILGINVPA